MKIDGEFLTNIRFADDIFLCTETPQERQLCYKNYPRKVGEWVFKMDIAKTNVMVVNNTPINVNNVLIENVKATYALDNTTASSKMTRTKRYKEESWQAGRHTPNTDMSSTEPLV